MYLHLGGMMIINTAELIAVENLEKTPLEGWLRQQEKQGKKLLILRRKAEVGDSYGSKDHFIPDLFVNIAKKTEAKAYDVGLGRYVGERTKNTGYNAEQIQILEGLEAVRKRPQYVYWEYGERGLHHLV